MDNAMLPSSLHSGIVEAGCDEAGRGCLAGPVVAAAVILPSGFTHELLVDSKKLSHQQRYVAREVVLANALAVGVGWCSPVEIENFNILNCSIMAMHKALDALGRLPEHVVVDGNRFKPWRFVPYTTVVKGDAKLANIAAASIIAKTTRDDIMQLLDHALPGYGLGDHKGYPTARHYEAIERLGPSPWHRATFRLSK